MDCLNAQQLISDAMDRVAVEPDLLEAAKSHCRQCPDCAAFVRTQLAVRKAGSPAPAEGLADRIVAAVRAEAASTKAASAAPDGTTATAESEQAPELPEAAAQALASLPPSTPRSAPRQPAHVWIAAAAGILLFAGIGALMAATIVGPSTQSTGRVASGTLDTQAVQQSAAVATDTSKAAAEAAPSTQAPISGPSFVAFGGSAYALRGESTVSRSGLATLGTTSSSLEAVGSPPASLTVLAKPGDTSVIYIDADDRLLEFARVQRDYGGTSYALQSGPIPGFGIWPPLPSGISVPTSADGAPTFESAESSAGAQVYVKKGSDASAGIAFPPGAAGPPEISAIPTWTWWTPIAR